ncbi:hypothetical protein NDA16_004835 [Ustilago loliicola]|nr:hypothetical protein NDA16_004835 [Ustilago loliicola]
MSDDSKFSSFDNICTTQETDSPTPPFRRCRAPIIIFGSQGADFLSAFDPILHLAGRQPELASFLSLSLDAARAELQSVANRQSDGLSTTEAQRAAEVELLAILPPFEPFSDLKSLVNFHRRTGLKDPVINGVLLCILQTACVVAVYSAAQRDNIDNEHAQAVLIDLKQAWKVIAQPCSHLLGFCTGALPAFSIRQVIEETETSSPSNIWIYAQEAIKAIRICFWISLRSAQARIRLTKGSGSLTSFDHWSIVVSFKEPDGAERVCQCLSKFNMLERKRPLDTPAPLTLTARAINQLSIGGPPQSLIRFMPYLAEHMGSDGRALPLEIFSPYHSPDLTVEKELVILDLERRGLFDDDTFLPTSQKILWETASADILSSANLRDALRVLIDSNLCSIADWDTMIDRLLLLEGELPAPTSTDRRVIVSFGPGANLAADLKKRFSSQHSPNSASDATTLLDVPVLLREMLRHDSELLGPERPLLHPDVSGDDVVIVSMACRFPGDVRTPEQLWTCLETGRSTVTEIPKHLFDIDAYYGDGINQTLARHMHALPENVVKSMDARLFSMSPKEIEQLDPQHRLVMLCSYEALERAGYSAEANSPSSFDGKRIAVCMGASWDDYRENASWNIGSYFITGNIRAFVPGHVSFSLKWEGPSVSVDSLECSAVSAIQWSRRALLSGQCDVALAGAVNVLTQPQMFIAMDKEGILSRSGTNATFSSKLDGKTRGDGCGVLLLKRRSTAIRDGDKILATLPAARTTYHGQSSSRQATSAQQSNFLARVVSEAGLQPSDLAHIEASGFHAKEGEAAEFDSFARLLAHTNDRSARQSGQKEHGVSVASLRPNIGAGESVSAMAALMKAVLILEKGTVPRQESISHPSELQPDIAATCSASKLFVPIEARLLPPSTGKNDRRHILVNSLASTGCHGVLLVGSPTNDEKEPPCNRAIIGNSISEDKCAWVFVLSAKTKESGEMLKKSLIDYLQRDVCLADLSYTLACRRTYYTFRLSVVASEQDELIRRLRGAEFVEAKPSADLPPFRFEFCSPTGPSTPDIKAFFSSTWAIRDRFEEFAASMSLLGAREQKESRALMQMCLASVLEDCGVSPSLVSGDNSIVTLFFEGGIDKESMLKAFGESEPSDRQNTLYSALRQRFATSSKAEEDPIKNVNSLLLRESSVTDLTTPHSVVAKLEERAESGKRYCSVIITHTVGLSDDEGQDGDKYKGAHTDHHVLQRSFLSSLGRLYQRGYKIRWIEYFRPYLPHLSNIDTLPTYPFHLQQFWMDYHDRNLIQHVVYDSVGTPAAQVGEVDGFEDTATEAVTMEPEEPLTQPLLTTQVGADSKSRIYISDLTDETQAALLQVASPSATLIELMVEAAIEASASLDVVVDTNNAHTLGLCNVRVQSAARDLLNARDAKLTVALDGQCQGRQDVGVQLHCDSQSAALGECRYQWLDSNGLDRRWVKMQRLLREKINRIKDGGEMMDVRLVYKSIGGGDAKSSRSIRSAHFETQSYDVVFCIAAPSRDSMTLADGQCGLALLLSTLEECTRWYHSNFITTGDGPYGIFGISDVLIRHKWLESLKQAGRSTKSYMALVSPGMFAKFDPRPANGLMVDMLLLDDELHLVGELTSVQLAKVESSSNKPMPKTSSPSAAPVVRDLQPETSSVPVLKTQDVQPQSAAEKLSTAKRPSAAEDVHAKMMAVLASELGIAVGEMKPSVKFADLGLDSLMSLVCISTLETLNLGFEIPQSLFMECDSPEELLAWIREQVGDASADSIAEAVPDLGSATKTVTGPNSVEELAIVPTHASTPAPVAPQARTAAQSTQGHSAVDEAMKTITTTIETELGVAEGSINPDANLADLGMDSLMSLLVLGNLSGMLSFELPSSLFMDCTSLREIRAFLASELGGGESNNAEPATFAIAPQASMSAQIAAPSFTIPPAKNPVLLRKDTDPTRHLNPLFLLPDGSGMSTVYQFIHAIDRPVYSINSPFLADASAWDGASSRAIHPRLPESCIPSATDDYRRLDQHRTGGEGCCSAYLVGKVGGALQGYR